MSKAAEQSYLEKIGADGWQHSREKPFSDEYCGINLAAIGTIISLLPPPPARLLDMGCGAGWTSVFFAKRGYEVVGQDISQDMIRLSEENRARNSLENLSFVQGDYEDLTFSREFDCVVFFDSLHHSDDELLAIGSAYRALKPGGVLLTHEPGEGHAANPASIEAMQLYGVNERDMPPELIIRRGEEVGFTQARTFPLQHDIQEIFYGDRPPRLLSTAGYFLAKRLLELVFKPSLKASSIVIMVKPIPPGPPSP